MHGGEEPGDTVDGEEDDEDLGERTTNGGAECDGHVMDIAERGTATDGT